MRVNKITVSFNDDGSVTINLYKTNVKLGELTNADIEVQDFEFSDIPNKNIYMQYCKDIVINLLQNGGIDGYYYEEKHISGNEQSKKYTVSSFVSETRKILTTYLDNMELQNRNVKYDIMNRDVNDTQVDITEKYKDGNVKYGMAEFKVTFVGNKEVNTKINVYIKSGQICKPKFIDVDGHDKGFNVTAIASIVR